MCQAKLRRRPQALELALNSAIMVKQLSALVILVPAILLAACTASGPRYADTKQSIPPLTEGKGRIYFYRAGGVFGSALQPPIALNGEVIGRSQPAGFFYVDRPPGNYEAACPTELTLKVKFVLESGQERYVKTLLTTEVIQAHLEPALVDPAVAKKEMVKLHYAPEEREEKQPGGK